MRPAIVTDTIIAAVKSPDGAGCAKVQLAYEPDSDPFAVHMLFPEYDEDDEDDAPEWAFARDLLASGLYRRSGDGDVLIWPGVRTGLRPQWFLHFELRSPEGTAVLDLPRDPVRSFLLASYRAVPIGREVVDVDRAVARILGGVA